jgi:hypothetical protein
MPVGSQVVGGLLGTLVGAVAGHAAANARAHFGLLAAAGVSALGAVAFGLAAVRNEIVGE